MKLSISPETKAQADPFIFEDDGKFYIYATASKGVDAYYSDDLFGEWKYQGIVTDYPEGFNFWAPSVIKIDNVYYMYASCQVGDSTQLMKVFTATSPLGPFKYQKTFYDYFSIDSHVVQNEKGLFLWFAKNNVEPIRKGTRIYIDRLVTPLEVENNPREMVVPTFDEEFFTPNCTADKKWHTIEGPTYFYEDGYHYLMYSGGCYLDDTYHIGYCYQKSNEKDLTKLDLIKNTDDGKFAPVIIKNEFEEGTGHHSVIKHNGNYYAVYHARDYGADTYARTARICLLEVKDGKIIAKRHPHKL